jgi:hypothetical protein
MRVREYIAMQTGIAGIDPWAVKVVLYCFGWQGIDAFFRCPPRLPGPHAGPGEFWSEAFGHMARKDA